MLIAPESLAVAESSWQPRNQIFSVPKLGFFPAWGSTSGLLQFDGGAGTLKESLCLLCVFL